MKRLVSVIYTCTTIPLISLPCYYSTALEDKIRTSGEVSVLEIADYLNHGKRITGEPEDQKTIKLAKLVAKALMKFSSSSDDILTAKHVPTLEHEENKYILDDIEKYQQEVRIPITFCCQPH